ncbi:glycosyltransferase [Actinopolymorpha pittospori]|uniref:GT2 family glycosyltransferase n=1 Tax=Actinopolymorpha pittospori TaxID=648752 RepID=A0A927RHQ0_9ACTN|nr:glycosyltransferase [Actinopolymorpha pittospori]MBE1612450.1 GT2 family glycosyltransferase [Actinopolymorpha pittospori]
MIQPEVSILLVSWNTLAETRACLESLPRSVDDDLSYEVIAVDNGSRDGSAEMLADWPRVHLVRNEVNTGFAAAVNQAYARAGGAYVLLLNSDIQFRPGALSVLARFLHDHPDAAGVAPLYLNPDGTIQQHYMRLPSFPSALAAATALRWLPGFRQALNSYLMRGADFSRARPVEQPSASCLLLRRRDLDPDVVLDERLPIYFNDVLLARALAAKGRQLWMTPDAVLVHTMGASTKLLGRRARSQHHLGGLVRYLRLTQPGHRVALFQSLALLDRLGRRVLRGRHELTLPEAIAAVRGDVGPLPDGDSRTWVVMLSGVRWSSGSHRQHALAQELAGDYRVLFVDPPTHRPAWRLTVDRVAPSVWRANAPSPLPFGRHLPPVNRVNRSVAAAALCRWLDQAPARRLLWLDDDLAASIAGRLEETAVVYDAVDLDWTFTRRWNRAHLRRGLQEAVAAADLVLASSPALPDRLPKARREPVVVPNACDPDLFTPVGEVNTAIARQSGPHLCYTGAIDTRAFDARLVATVARRHPRWTFHLVGPATPAGRAPLAGLPNVHLTGPVPFEEVPAIIRACDVCLIPYRLGGLIDYVHPKKLYEYLAAGKPVVATALPALTAMEGLLHLAANAEEFEEGIEKALASATSPTAVAARRQAAKENSWSARGRQVRALLATLEDV